MNLTIVHCAVTQIESRISQFSQLNEIMTSKDQFFFGNPKKEFEFISATRPYIWRHRQFVDSSFNTFDEFSGKFVKSITYFLLPPVRVLTL